MFINLKLNTESNGISWKVSFRCLKKAKYTRISLSVHSPGPRYRYKCTSPGRRGPDPGLVIRTVPIIRL